MTDYLLRFASKQIAEQFGVANGFAALDENGEVQSSLASHTHALCEIGEHFTGGDEDTPARLLRGRLEDAWELWQAKQ
jgi:hypothetical protein